MPESTRGMGEECGRDSREWSRGREEEEERKNSRVEEKSKSG